LVLLAAVAIVAAVAPWSSFATMTRRQSPGAGTDGAYDVDAGHYRPIDDERRSSTVAGEHDSGRDRTPGARG
jgi:hypothetical protein